MTAPRRLPVPVLAALVLAATHAAAQPPADKAVRAEAVLKKHCRSCHGADKDARNGLYVLDPAQLHKLVRPGKGDESELVRLVKAGNMPPGRNPKLSDDEVRALREWVDDGATP